MKVQNIQNNYYSYNTPQFKAWNRVVYTQPANPLNRTIIHCNRTEIFREPNPYISHVKSYWKVFLDYIINKYQNIPKVNVYSLACSNGAEAVSMVMGLITRLNESEFKKYMPIKASDYDEEAIKCAKSGCLPINYTEAQRIDDITYNQFGEFFYKGNPSNKLPKEDYFRIPMSSRDQYFKGLATNYSNQNVIAYTDEDLNFELKPIITDNIQYKVADAVEECLKIEPDNSIVNASNFWLYLGKEKANKLASLLYQQLGNNSCLRVGSFDDIFNIDRILTNAGFRLSKIPYVYEK